MTRAWPLWIVGLLGALLLFVVSGPIARRFGSDGPHPTALARLVDVRGAITRVRGAETERHSEPPLDFADGDRLESGPTTTATIALTSGDELEVAGGSTLAFELWNERDPNSPIYLHVITGDVSAKRAGVRGRAYVVRRGRLYLPGQTPGRKAPPLLIGRGNTPDLYPERPNDDLADRAPAPESASPSASHDPETLANEYVEEMVASRQAQFQKCWLGRLKEKPKLKGTINVQFEITRRGKVRDVKVTEGSLNDPALASCVTTIVERLPFRSFTGPEISISYPIRFE